MEKYPLAVLGMLIGLAIVGFISPTLTSFGTYYQGNFINEKGEITRTALTGKPVLGQTLVFDGQGYISEPGFWRCTSKSGASVVITAPGTVDLNGKVECKKVTK